MTENAMLKEAIAAIHGGQRNRARDLLTRLLRADQNNPEYWLWMSAVVDTAQEQIFCLQSVVRLDPENSAARNGLTFLGAEPAGEDITPAAPVHRNWVSSVSVSPRSTALETIRGNRMIGGAAIFGLAVVVIAMIVFGMFGAKRRPALALRPTKARDLLSTFTPTPTKIIRNTATPVPPTPTQAFYGPIPLAQRLDATYTPTPFYIATPHPVNEAYRAGTRAMERGDMSAALDYFHQAIRIEPGAADIHYFIGEILLSKGDITGARQSFEKAININPYFGPAYLGRAHALLAADPSADIQSDLDLAILNDPEYPEAYIERALHWLSANNFDAAAQDLDQAATLNPSNPLLYVYRSRIEMHQGAVAAALEDARHALDADITLLPAYLQFGKAALANGLVDEATNALETYTTFSPKDLQGWVTLGRSYITQGRDGTAILTARKALALNDQFSQAYYIHGLASLNLMNLETAVNDLKTANKLEPNSFEINLALGRAFLMSGQNDAANNTFKTSQALAVSDYYKAQFNYWRAITFESLGNQKAANQEWTALVALPDSAVPTEWRKIANERLAPPPTETSTSTPTPESS